MERLNNTNEAFNADSLSDQTVEQFQDLIREHGEKRIQPGWNFCHYFLVQVKDPNFYFDLIKV